MYGGLHDFLALFPDVLHPAWLLGGGFASAAFRSAIFLEFQMSPAPRKRPVRIPSNLLEATKACMENALKKHNRGLQRVAELMNIGESALYKKIGDGRITTGELAAFEHICGATYITEFLCARAHLLAVEMPTGRKLQAADVMEMQQHFSEAMALLIGFFKGEADQDETLSALTSLMGEIGWHRANVERASSPEFELFGETK